MTTILEKLNRLNEADLSRLQSRIRALIEDATKPVKPTKQDGAKPSAPTSLTMDELLALIEAAKKVT